jgi:hypothetical protein
VSVFSIWAQENFYALPRPEPVAARPVWAIDARSDENGSTGGRVVVDHRTVDEMGSFNGW